MNKKLYNRIIEKYKTINNCYEQNRGTITRTTLYRILKNNKKTTVQQLEALAKVLGMTLEEVVKEIE